MRGRIDHIGVVVDDLGAVQRFLQEVLGMELTVARRLPASKLTMALFGYDGLAQVELIELDDPDARRLRLGSERARVEHIAIEVEDLFKTRDELRVRGVEMQSEVPSVNGPTRSFFTRPETSHGIAFQFLERRRE